jgi:hypothetical protein
MNCLLHVTRKNNMINLAYNYYKTNEDSRNQELLTCFTNLKNNSKIDNFLILNETDELIENGFVERERVKVQRYIDILNNITSPNDINIIINSDCYIVESNIEKIKNSFGDGEFWCLSRNDVPTNRMMEAQDAWIFKGKTTIKADFYLGKPGCDNRLAFLASELNYRVLNPSLDICMNHVHANQTSTYFEHERIPKPYCLVTPCSSTLKNSQVFMI